VVFHCRRRIDNSSHLFISFSSLGDNEKVISSSLLLILFIHLSVQRVSM
jgi:hypothetical protein